MSRDESEICPRTNRCHLKLLTGPRVPFNCTCVLTRLVYADTQSFIIDSSCPQIILEIITGKLNEIGRIKFPLSVDIKDINYATE